MNNLKKEEECLAIKNGPTNSDNSQRVTPPKFLIVMIAPTPFYSGRGTHMRILHEANALAERGHRIIIVTYHNGTTPDNLHPNITIRRIIRFLFWYTQIAPGPNWQKIFLDMLLCIKVLRISKKEKPEILHGHLHEGILIGWVVKKLLYSRRLILVGDFHGPLVEEMRSHGYLRFSLIQKVFNFIEKTIHRMPDRVFVSSPGLKQKIDGDRKENDSFVLSDAPTMSYRSTPPMGLTCNRPESDLPCVVYTGGFTPDKGLEQLFEVISHSMKNGLHCRWIIAGDPLNQLIVPADIKTAITVISPLGHGKLSEILQQADVACDPKQGNILQGSGKLLNYMYAGLPMICFDGPAQRFYLGAELAAIFIARDIEDCYDILKTLLAMPADEKRKLKAKILKRVNEFSWAQSAQILEHHYAEQRELNHAMDNV